MGAVGDAHGVAAPPYWRRVRQRQARRDPWRRNSRHDGRVCLSKAGYRCRSSRPGRGPVDGSGRTRRRPDRGNGFHAACRMAGGSSHYFNAGAARISSHHQGVLERLPASSAFRWKSSSTTTAPRLSRSIPSSTANLSGKADPRRYQGRDRGSRAAKGAPTDEGSRTCCGSSAISERDMTYAGSSRAGYAAEDDMPGAGTQSGPLRTLLF